MVPSLCVVEPLTGVIRPRNFAMLLFGRQPQKFVRGAFAIFSVYPGRDRSESHAERHEIAGTAVEQVARLTSLLEAQAPTIFDKEDRKHPNKVRYPIRALTEALGNALAHRDYEVYEPVRITAFADRIEFVSPGPLLWGIDRTAFRTGRSGPRWRNQVLAWFFNRLDIAQAEGQGIQTMLRTMAAAGCPPPELDANDAQVICVLRQNPVAERMAARNGGSDTSVPSGDGAPSDRDAQKNVLLRAIVAAGSRGVRRADLAALVPQASENELKVLLRDLREARKIHSRGATAAARWYAGPAKRRR